MYIVKRFFRFQLYENVRRRFYLKLLYLFFFNGVFSSTSCLMTNDSLGSTRPYFTCQVFDFFFFLIIRRLILTYIPFPKRCTSAQSHLPMCVCVPSTAVIVHCYNIAFSNIIIVNTYFCLCMCMCVWLFQGLARACRTRYIRLFLARGQHSWFGCLFTANVYLTPMGFVVRTDY